MIEASSYKTNEQSGDKLKIPMLYLLSGLALVVEWLVIRSDLSIIEAFVSHVLIANLCILFVYLSSHMEWDLRFPLLLTILVATLGPLGAVIFLMTLVLFQVYSRTAQTIKDLLSSLVPKFHSDPAKDVYERIVYGLEDFEPDVTPLPFMDVITFGTDKQKRLAIEKILRYFHPLFSPALATALQDENNGIRVLAATAVATLDKLYFDKYLALEKKYHLSPDNLKTILAFAQHCDDYAVTSEILDEDKSKQMISHAIEAYERCYKMDPKDLKVAGLLGRLYVKDNRHIAAKKHLEGVLVNSSIKVPVEIYKWYMCALYQLEEYSQLRRFATDSLPASKTSRFTQELKELIHLWGSEDRLDFHLTKT